MNRKNLIIGLFVVVFLVGLTISPSNNTFTEKEKLQHIEPIERSTLAVDLDVTYRPDGDSSVSLYDYPTTPTTHYDDVNEVSQDGDTSYVRSIAFNYVDHYTMDDSSGRTEVITKVTLYGYFKLGFTSGDYAARFEMKLGSTVEYGTGLSLTDAYTLQSWERTLNPDEETWSWDDIDDLLIGCYLITVFEGPSVFMTQIYAIVTYTNEAPETPTLDTFTGLIDTDKMLAEYNYVTQNVTAVDLDGYEDIDYVEYSFYDNTRSSEHWSILWTRSTDTFSEYDQPQRIILGDCDSTLSGNTAELRFNFTADFDWSLLIDGDIQARVIDSQAQQTYGYYEDAPDNENRLDFQNENIYDASGTTNRGDIDGYPTAEGNCHYYGYTAYHPYNTSFYIKMTCTDVASSPWTTYGYDETDGSFSLTVQADDLVGEDTYYFEGYKDAASRSISTTDTYIADRGLLTFTPDDTTPYGNSDVTITVAVTFDYDDLTCSTWSIMVTRDTVDWTTKTDSFTDNQPKDTDYIYSCSTFADSTHGLTEFSATPSSEVTWINNDPVIVSVTCDNPTDTNNLLPYYVEYQFTLSITDADGYADIDYLEITLYHYFTDYWIVRFDQDTSTFTVEYGGAMIDLSQTNSEYTEDGSSLIVTFHLNVTWAHTNPQPTYPLNDELSIEGDVIDSDAATDYLDNDLDLDIHTKVFHDGNHLDMPYCDDNSDNVGDFNQAFFIYAKARYYSDGVSRYVPSSAMDVWVYQADGYYGTETGPWVSTTWGTDAFYNVTCYADDVGQLVYYQVRYVAEGTGFAGTQLFYDYPSYTYMRGLFYAAQIYVMNYYGDYAAPVGEQCYMKIQLGIKGLWTWLSSGTWEVNGAPLYYSGSSGWWWINDTEYSPTLNTYDTVTDAFPLRDENNGLSYVNQDSESAYVIWSNYNVTSISVLDNRVDLNTAVSVNVTLYDYYSGLPVTDETVWVNNLPMEHLGSGIYGLVTPLSYSTASAFTFDTVTVNGDSNFNVTGYYTVNMAGQSETVIWDKVKIYMTLNMTWCYTGYYINVYGDARYMYDNTTAGFSLMTIYSLGDGQDFDVKYDTIGERPFYVTAFTETTYGITGWETTTENCIWDAMQVPSITYYWTQESETSVWLHIDTGNWYFTFDNDPMSYYTTSGDSIIRAHKNGTQDAYSIIGASGGLDDLLIGPFGPDWYYVNITLFWQATIQGISYNITAYSFEIEVDIRHSLQIVNWNIIPTDYYFWIVYQTNMLNASITIWDDAIDSGTLFADNIYHSTSEGMHQIEVSSIIGIHNLTICITTTGIEYDKTYESGYYIIWYNLTYVVGDELVISNIAITDTTAEVSLIGTASKSGNYWIYSNNTYQSLTGSFVTGSFTVSIPKKTAIIGLHRWSVLFNDSSTSIWVNGSYSTDVTAFAIYDLIYTLSETMNTLSGMASIDCEYHVYEIDVLIKHGEIEAGAFAIEWSRNDAEGEVEWTVHFYVGRDLITVSSHDLTEGVYVSGNLDSIQTDDSDYYIFEETTGAPGFMYYFNFTGDNVAGMNLLTLYDNTASHTISLQIYNYDTLTWDTLGYISNGAVWIWHNFSVNVDYDYSENNIIMGRLNHESPGSLADTFMIDYIGIVTYTYYRCICGSYYNAPVEFTISTFDVDQSTNYVTLSGYITKEATYIIYEEDIQVGSGSITSTGLFSILWSKAITIGDIDFSVFFTDTDETETIQINGTYTVAIAAVLSIDWDFGLTETVVFVTGDASLGCTYTIYEDTAQIGSGTLSSSSSSSFWLEWARQKSTDPQTVDVAVKFVNSTTTIWTNFSYTEVQLEVFRVESWWLDLNLGVENYIEGFVKTTFENATIYVYDNGTLQLTVTEDYGGIFFYWWMNTGQGLHNIVLNVTHGSDVFTLERTYFIPDWATTAFVFRYDIYTWQNSYTLITLESNWMNATYSIYLNSSLVAYSIIDPVTLNISRTINQGEWNLTIYADAGSATQTVSNIRYVVTDNGVVYDYSQVEITGGGTAYYSGDTFNTYENPTGAYISTEVIATVIVGILLGAVLLYLILSRWAVVIRGKWSLRNQS